MGLHMPAVFTLLRLFRHRNGGNLDLSLVGLYAEVVVRAGLYWETGRVGKVRSDFDFSKGENAFVRGFEVGKR